MIDNSIMIVKIYLLPPQRYARRDVLLMDMFLTKRLNSLRLIVVPRYYFYKCFAFNDCPVVIFRAIGNA